MNENRKAIAVVVALGLVGVLTLISGADSQSVGVIIRSVGNTSLCVRTRAYKADAAIMKLEDCERPMYIYDGQKVHYQDEERHISTMWAHSAGGFGVGGCLFSLEDYVRVNEECSQNASWEFSSLPQNDSLSLWRNIEGDNCVRAPKLEDETIVELGACDENDINQQWLIEFQI